MCPAWGTSRRGASSCARGAGRSGVGPTGRRRCAGAHGAPRGRRPRWAAPCAPRRPASMGGRIEGAGSAVRGIEGVASLRGTAHCVMPDRIELGTYLAAAAAAGGKVRLIDAAPDSLDATLEKLRECGARIEVADRSIEIEMAARPKAVSLRTAPYPRFATDLQAQFIALPTIPSGPARIPPHI